MTREIDSMSGEHIDIKKDIMPYDDTISYEGLYFFMYIFPFWFSYKHVIADASDHGNIFF